MPVSEDTYKRVALEDDDERWELACGQLRVKPAMTARHGWVLRGLATRLRKELDSGQYMVAEDSARLRVSTGSYYVPDGAVLPMAMVRTLLRDAPDDLEVYEQPVPFVAEVWSPPTGTYDVDEKFPEYRRRGDREIWRLHPIERTVIGWRRQPDGSYTETYFQSGQVRLHALPDVTIDLDSLFA